MNIEIIRQIHRGRNNIYIVEYKGRVYILKKPNRKHRRKSLKRYLKRIKFWEKYGLSSVKAIIYHKAILKTYIKGKTFDKIIDKDKQFFSNSSNSSNSNDSSNELIALRRFVELLIDSKHFIHDMKMSNLVYSENKFQIIDSGPIYKRRSKSSLKKEYQKILYIKWSKLLDSTKERRHLKKFLKLRI